MNRESLSRVLAELPGLIDEAHQTWGTSVSPAESEIPANRVLSTGPVLADLDRLVALAPVEVRGESSVGTIRAWADHVERERDEVGVRPYLVRIGAGRPHRDCGYLRINLDFSEGRGWEDDMERELTDLWTTLRGILRIRDDGAASSALPRLAALRADRRLLTATEAEAEFGIPRGTIYVWANRGKVSPRYSPWDLVRAQHPDLTEYVDAIFQSVAEESR